MSARDTAPEVKPTSIRAMREMGEKPAVRRLRGSSPGIAASEFQRSKRAALASMMIWPPWEEMFSPVARSR